MYSCIWVLMYSFIEFIKQFRDGCKLDTPLAFRLSPYFDTYAILKIFILELYLNGSKLVHVWFVILRYLISNFKGLKLFATASKQVETWEVNWDSDKYVICYIKIHNLPKNYLCHFVKLTYSRVGYFDRFGKNFRFFNKSIFITRVSISLCMSEYLIWNIRESS